MWWKRRILLVSLCAFLVFILILGEVPVGKAAGSAIGPEDGFMIEADRVVGSGMTASIVSQETSANDARPMLRFHYESATIYGMRLTKKVGSVNIIMKAAEPVTVKGMTVDTTAITFKGACLHAGESIPEVGMENVVMVAHYMNSSDSVLNGLVLTTNSGKMETAEPSELQILQDLSLLPLNQVQEEIGKISSGHLPLTCEDPGKKKGSLTDPLKDVIGIVTSPLEPVLEPVGPVLKELEPVLKPVGPVLKELEPVLKPVEPVLKELEPVLKPVGPVLKELEPVLKPVEPVLKELEPVLKPVNPVLKPLDPILKPLDPVLNPLDPILKPSDPAPGPENPGGNPLDPIGKPLDPVLGPLEPILKPLDPILKPILRP